MKPRPQTLPAKVTKIKTGYGNLYVTITEFEGKPWEVFCTIGKSGAGVMAKAEVTGRLASLALRHGIPVEEVIHQLLDIRGDHPTPFKAGVVKSIPDAVGKILEERYGGAKCPTTQEKN